MDVALVHAAQEENSDLVQLLILVRPGSTDRILSHLAQHGLKPERASTPNIVAVQLPGSMLRSIARDADVLYLAHTH